MKLQNQNYFNLAQILLGISFIFLMFFPSRIPFHIAKMLESSLGVISFFAVTIALFYYANPLLACLFILLGYMLLCKCSASTKNTGHIQYTPTGRNNNHFEKPPTTVTLEELTVSKMAPIDRNQSQYIDSTFKPMYQKSSSGALLM